MYLSRVELDEGKINTMRALLEPQKLHGAIEQAFPGERRRRLWRLDRLKGTLYLLLLSEEEPNLAGLAAQFGPEDGRAETRDYAPLLQRIAPGSAWQFRLTANPTKSRMESGQEKRGKVQPHITAEHQSKWLLDRAEKHGFALDPAAFTVTASGWLHFSKGDKNRVSLLSATYEGVLQVTDADLFRQTLTRGIGRGKAYGQGLLTVLPRRDGR